MPGEIFELDRMGNPIITGAFLQKLLSRLDWLEGIAVDWLDQQPPTEPLVWPPIDLGPVEGTK